MILYTPLPLEYVFEGIDNMQAPQEVVIGGITMQVEMISESQARIIRLISPDPSHYLDAKYAPGTIIQFSPVL